MKNFKQLLLALVAVFAAVLLVACGLKSDNGTYVLNHNRRSEGDANQVNLLISLQMIINLGFRLSLRTKKAL